MQIYCIKSCLPPACLFFGIKSPICNLSQFEHPQSTTSWNREAISFHEKILTRPTRQLHAYIRETVNFMCVYNLVITPKRNDSFWNTWQVSMGQHWIARNTRSKSYDFYAVIGWACLDTLKMPQYFRQSACLAQSSSHCSSFSLIGLYIRFDRWWRRLGWGWAIGDGIETTNGEVGVNNDHPWRDNCRNFKVLRWHFERSQACCSWAKNSQVFMI